MLLVVLTNLITMSKNKKITKNRFFKMIKDELTFLRFYDLYDGTSKEDRFKLIQFRIDNNFI